MNDDDAPAPWTLDIKVRARNGLMVSGLGLSSEWTAQVQIAGTPTNPAITGRADLVRGEYEFAGRTFDLDRGAIDGCGTAPAVKVSVGLAVITLTTPPVALRP